MSAILDPKYIPLKEWAARMFGDTKLPHDNTLLNWVHQGKITPMPKKIARKWWVRPNAEYQDN
jgi:hypothetical protein